ncbi:MAG TPA: Rrf2 family transcriptional regulator [Candidatus Omnitrophota bacterium]|nr:Rrf2 family transcriptional regulator [Candidatus Omnitrophota bacterium]
MKLTTKSEYSILALVFLARRERSGYVKIEEICDKYDISHKYLEQLFIILKNNHFIKSKRGKDGGYCLARPSAGIKIADVIRLMDGALAPVESASKYFYAHSPVEKEKKVLAVFRDIRDYISDKMERLKLSQLV